MKRTLQNLSVATLILSSTFANAQNVGINATGAAPSGDAMLDIASTNKGLLIPRVSIANLATIAPITGGTTTSLLVYNTNATTGQGYYYWNGTAWVNLSGDDWKITGNAGTVAGTNFLGTTDNVDFSIRRNNIEKIRVLNTTTSFMDEIQTRDGGANSGDVLVRIFDSGDDGIIDIYENNGMNIRLHGNGVSVFNEQGIASNDFRIESDARANMFFVDAGLNNIGINTATPANMFQFVSDGRTGWVTQWLNNSINGGLKQIYNTPTGNGSRVVMGVTNYSGSAQAASAVMGLSLNGTSTGSGGIGVTGSANNESGTGVEGTLAFSGGYTGWAGYFNADVFSGGTYFGSDRRLKREIKPYSGALETIKRIKPVTYYYDTEKYPGIGFDENRLMYGFIAQDIEQIIPEMVKDKILVLNANKKKTLKVEEERETDVFKVVNYSVMIPILTQAVKEQQAIIEGQNARLDELEKLVKELLSKKQ